MRKYCHISGMHLVTCDINGCTSEQFRSASVPKMIETQLLLAGWSLIEVEVKNSLSWEAKELCPAHRPSGPRIGTRMWRERKIRGAKDAKSGRLAH